MDTSRCHHSKGNTAQGNLLGPSGQGYAPLPSGGQVRAHDIRVGAHSAHTSTEAQGARAGPRAWATGLVSAHIGPSLHSPFREGPVCSAPPTLYRSALAGGGPGRLWGLRPGQHPTDCAALSTARCIARATRAEPLTWCEGTCFPLITPQRNISAPGPRRLPPRVGPISSRRVGSTAVNTSLQFMSDPPAAPRSLHPLQRPPNRQRLPCLLSYYYEGNVLFQ